MTQMLAPPAVVAPPQATPPAHGLIESANQVDELDDRWQLGFTFAPETCTKAKVWAPSCSGNPSFDAPAANPDSITYDPVTLWAPFKCFSDDVLEGDYEGRAKRALAQSESAALEHEFWTGTQVATNPHLTMAGSTVVTTTAVSAIGAVALLGQALADNGTGARGVLHFTSQMAELVTAQYLVETPDGLLVTRARGDVVVVGAGYPGTGPEGDVNEDPGAGKTWAFATSGPVDVRLGDVVVVPEDLAGALDRTYNKVTYRAERVAAATWDGCVLAAALVDLSL